MTTRHATLSRAFSALGLMLAAGAASANPVHWTDWSGTDNDPGVGFIGKGSITTPTSSVNVTYTNAQGIAFYQTQGGTDYWGPRSPAVNSPYTSSQVDNPPTGSDIIGLQYAGLQTLSFSQAVANPVLAYVSLNGNGYAFLNRDFEILSYGAGTGAAAPGNNSCGHWGCGTSSKQVVDLGNGNIEYRLIGTGEPHGAIRFTGSFDTLTWRSMSSETWNGFTVGVQGTAAEVPVPAPWLLLVAGGAGLLAARRKRKVQA